MLSAKFYLYEYWPHWTTMLTGNGLPHIASAYGREMDLIIQYFRFFRSDVGIVGAFNKFGIFYVIIVFGLIIKCLKIKIHNNEDKYLKLFFFNALFLIITNESFSNERVIPFYCFILYLIDKSIEKYKEESPTRSVEKNTKESMMEQSILHQ